MYLYLCDGDVDLKELRRAFDWNRGGDSSFLDIKPEDLAKTPWSIIARSVGDAVEKGVEKSTEKVLDRFGGKGESSGREAAESKMA